MIRIIKKIGFEIILWLVVLIIIVDLMFFVRGIKKLLNNYTGDYQEEKMFSEIDASKIGAITDEEPEFSLGESGGGVEDEFKVEEVNIQETIKEKEDVFEKEKKEIAVKKENNEKIKGEVAVIQEKYLETKKEPVKSKKEGLLSEQKETMPGKKELLKDEVPDTKKEKNIVKKTEPIEKKEVPVLFVDEFDEDVMVNKLGGSSKCFEQGKGDCSSSFYYDANIPNTYNDRSGKYSLRLSFNVDASGSVGGFITELKNIDLRGYRFLSFWVKGKNGREIFKVSIDDGTKTSQISIGRFFPDGLFYNWNRVRIPLGMFSDAINWGQINGSLSFIFEYNGSNVSQGVIYLDEIVFE